MRKIFIPEDVDKFKLIDELGLKKFVEVLTEESRAVVDEYIYAGKKIPFPEPKLVPYWERQIFH